MSLSLLSALRSDSWILMTITETYFWLAQMSTHKSSPSEMLLGKSVLKICSKFTGEYPYRKNHSYVWEFFCKFDAYFQNTFSVCNFYILDIVARHSTLALDVFSRPLCSSDSNISFSKIWMVFFEWTT